MPWCAVLKINHRYIYIVSTSTGNRQRGTLHRWGKWIKNTVAASRILGSICSTLFSLNAEKSLQRMYPCCIVLIEIKRHY